MAKNHDIERLATALEKHTKDDEIKFGEAKDQRVEIHEAVKDLNVLIKELREDLKPIRKAYNGFLFGKNFVVGLASVLLAIAAIGGTVIAFIEFVIKK